MKKTIKKENNNIQIDISKLPCNVCEWRWSIHCPKCEWNKKGKVKVY